MTIGARSSTDADDKFVAFVKAHGRALARTATLITGDPVAGEDLLQTALAQTYARWRRCRDIDDLEQYVRVVLVRAHISWRRRMSSGEVTHDLDPEEHLGPDIAERLVDRRVLLQALRRLPPKQRAALVLRYFDDLSEAATAAALGCSQGSVKQHTSRGLARLRTLIGSELVVIS